MPRWLIIVLHAIEDTLFTVVAILFVFLIALGAFGCGMGRHGGLELWTRPPTVKGKPDSTAARLAETCRREGAIDIPLCIAAKVNPWAEITYDIHK